MTVELLKTKFKTWCQRQIRGLNIQEGTDKKVVAKYVMRQLAKSQQCSEILRDLVCKGNDYKFKLEIKKDDDQARTKKEISRYLKKAIMYEYKMYVKSRVSHKEVLIIDDSCDSSTKSVSKLNASTQNDSTLQLASCSGHLLLGDKIAAIVDIQTKKSKRGKECSILIEWKARKDRVIPRSSWMQLEEIARLRPSALLDPKMYKSDTIMKRIATLLEKRVQ